VGLAANTGITDVAMTKVLVATAAILLTKVFILVLLDFV
jgi:hypothetical protein